MIFKKRIGNTLRNPAVCEIWSHFLREIMYNKIKKRKTRFLTVHLCTSSLVTQNNRAYHFLITGTNSSPNPVGQNNVWVESGEGIFLGAQPSRILAAFVALVPDALVQRCSLRFLFLRPKVFQRYHF